MLGLQVVGPVLHQDLLSHLVDLLPAAGKCLEHASGGVRVGAARCLGALGLAHTAALMPSIVALILPMLAGQPTPVVHVGSALVHAVVHQNVIPIL